MTPAPWQCPACKVHYAPTVTKCECSVGKNTTTWKVGDPPTDPYGKPLVVGQFFEVSRWPKRLDRIHETLIQCGMPEDGIVNTTRAVELINAMHADQKKLAILFEALRKAGWNEKILFNDVDICDSATTHIRVLFDKALQTTVDKVVYWAGMECAAKRADFYFHAYKQKRQQQAASEIADEIRNWIGRNPDVDLVHELRRIYSEESP